MYTHASFLLIGEAQDVIFLLYRLFIIIVTILGKERGLDKQNYYIHLGAGKLVRFYKQKRRCYQFLIYDLFYNSPLIAPFK